ncbi:MAG TPA: hypothetical protein PLI95_11835, partial [Polyangiaceae bacterium]|nr:hypothetical protein [Polyangiaceae bacterium]
CWDDSYCCSGLCVQNPCSCKTDGMNCSRSSWWTGSAAPNGIRAAQGGACSAPGWYSPRCPW